MQIARLPALLARVAAAVTIVGTLSGSLVVSCAGDPSSATGGNGGSNAPASQSMGRWTPATQDTCTKAFHDTFFVVGPDGKKYPTWHAAEAIDPATHTLCSFGHEHGPDPSGSAMWTKIRQHFAFDANNNGQIDASEVALSGVPFGYVSEQLVGSATPRLEDHTGYKIAYADAVQRSAQSSTVPFDSVTCDYFLAYNQPTSTADAFASNMFSVTYGVDCNAGTSQALYPVDAIVSVMALYRNPGFFTLSDGTQLDANQAPDPVTSPAGGNEAGRVIAASGDAFKVFVPVGGATAWTFLRERWETQLRLTRADTTVLATLAPVFRVDDPARFFDQTGTSAGGLAHSIDLCYWGLDTSGGLVTSTTLASTITLQVRNEGTPKCAPIAPNGPFTSAAQRLAFDDKSSPFRGCIRTASVGTEVVNNLNGSTIWYTTPLGTQASPTRFANSVIQRVAPADTRSIVLAPVSAGQQTACPAATVHAPN